MNSNQFINLMKFSIICQDYEQHNHTYIIEKFNYYIGDLSLIKQTVDYTDDLSDYHKTWNYDKSYLDNIILFLKNNYNALNNKPDDLVFYYKLYIGDPNKIYNKSTSGIHHVILPVIKGYCKFYERKIKLLNFIDI